MVVAPKIRLAFTITKYLSWSLSKYVSNRGLDLWSFRISVNTFFWSCSVHCRFKVTQLLFKSFITLSQSDQGPLSIISLLECKFIKLPNEGVTAFFTEHPRANQKADWLHWFKINLKRMQKPHAGPCLKSSIKSAANVAWTVQNRQWGCRGVSS